MQNGWERRREWKYWILKNGFLHLLCNCGSEIYFLYALVLVCLVSGPLFCFTVEVGNSPTIKTSEMSVSDFDLEDTLL